MGRFERLKPYLTKAPFTSWHEFKLMDANHVTVPANGSTTFDLPNGRKATLTFFGHATGSDEHRLRLKLVVEHPEKHHKVLDTTFVLDEGGVMLNAGQQKESGVWMSPSPARRKTRNFPRNPLLVLEFCEKNTGPRSDGDVRRPMLRTAVWLPLVATAILAGGPLLGAWVVRARVLPKVSARVGRAVTANDVKVGFGTVELRGLVVDGAGAAAPVVIPRLRPRWS